MEPSEKYLFKYKGIYFIPDLTTPEYLDSLKDFEVRDSDVFLVTYPKSGTVWTQQILSLIYHEGHRDGTENKNLRERIPWLEYHARGLDYVNLPSPRLFATHLPYYLVPKVLRNGRQKSRILQGNDSCAVHRRYSLVLSMDEKSGMEKEAAKKQIRGIPVFARSKGTGTGYTGAIIYVARNPKDVLVSYYHFSKFAAWLEEVEDFDILMERFLDGKVQDGSWLDHIEGWYAHRDDFNILFLMYEEMKKDLRGTILKICNFLGKRLTEEVLDEVVDKATFDKMRLDPRSNYENLGSDYIDLSKGRFLRKGTVGDWKNLMTVAQSERFDSVFKERMEKLPFKFCWDINDQL